MSVVVVIVIAFIPWGNNVSLIHPGEVTLSRWIGIVSHVKPWYVVCKTVIHKIKQNWNQTFELQNKEGIYYKTLDSLGDFFWASQTI